MASSVAQASTQNEQPATESDLPQVFGRYLLIKRLSRGGMGEIFLGRLGEIQGFEKPVIIKKILPNLAADEEFVKRFIDEAQVAIKLNHANIASVFEVGKVDDEYFLAIEYIEGRDLRRTLTKCRQSGVRMPVDLCLLVGRDLANGLGYAHRRTDTTGKALALVHCDISPPNVMVSFEGEVKVIDFGIAKSAIRIAGSNPNMGFGKFGYMAPEQLVRGGVVDKRTDIYAAGVVVYELLTGQRIFDFPEGADYRQIARIVTRGEFIPPSVRDPRVDPSLDAIIGKAIAARADERYQTCEEFRDAIQQALYKMNPTISSDALAAFLREQFAEEVEEERALVASAKAYDLDQFKEQLSGSETHTVTFARAGLLGLVDAAAAAMRPRTATGANRIIAGPPAGMTGVVAPQAAGNRNVWIAAAAAVAMIGGGALAYMVAKRPPPQVVVAPPLVPAPPVLTPIAGTPTVRPVEETAPKRPPRPITPRALVAATKSEPRPRPPVAEAPAPAPVSTAHSQEAVSAKFKAVKREYETFKDEYGGRLDGQWTSIVQEITFGHADKFAKVDAMLDSLRREMAKARAGG